MDAKLPIEEQFKLLQKDNYKKTTQYEADIQELRQQLDEIV